MISNLHENVQCSHIFALVAIEYLGFGPDEVLQIMWCQHLVLISRTLLEFQSKKQISQSNRTKEKDSKRYSYVFVVYILPSLISLNVA